MSAWDLEAVADALHGALARAAEAVELEQAVRGLDALDEVALHPLLADGLRAAGLGAWREERYPDDRARRRRSEGRRCDLVATPDALPLAADAAQLDLFAAKQQCRLDEALWIEVKTVAQFVEGGGGTKQYSRTLLGPAWKDVEKLAADGNVRHAAVLLVVFTADPETADHDVAAWASLGRRRGVPLGVPVVRRGAIGDRFGNRVLTSALFPVERA